MFFFVWIKFGCKYFWASVSESVTSYILFMITNLSFLFLHLGLFEAIKLGNTARVQGLLKANHHPDTYRDTNQDTCLHLAAANGNTKCLEMLIESGASLTATNIQDQTPLHLAVSNNHLSSVKIMLEHPSAKVAVNMCCRPDDNTPLCLAVNLGNHALIEMLRPLGHLSTGNIIT